MHSSKSKWVYGEPAGVLILFWVIVFVGLFLDEGALYLFIYLFILFIYAFTLIRIVTKGHLCIYRFCSFSMSKLDPLVA
jgi:hypothetical protein